MNVFSNGGERSRYIVNKCARRKSVMARCDVNLNESERKMALYGELVEFDQEVASKYIATQCKANVFRIANIASSFIVIIAGAVIVGIEAYAGCENKTAIALAAILTITQGLYEMFRWGPQGVFFKQSTIRLKKIRQNISHIKLMIQDYSSQKLLYEIRNLRLNYDDIDLSTYKISSGTATYKPDNIVINDRQSSPDIPTPEIARPNQHNPNRRHTKPVITIQNPDSPTLNTPVIGVPLTTKLNINEEERSGSKSLDIVNADRKGSKENDKKSNNE